MNNEQSEQYFSQIEFNNTMGTTDDLNTNVLLKALGKEIKSGDSFLRLNNFSSFGYWSDPSIFHSHKHYNCGVDGLENIGIELVAQERDIYAVKKMMTHLRALKSCLRSRKDLSPEQKKILEFKIYCLHLGSRQKYIRDQMFYSYKSNKESKTRSSTELKKVFRVPEVTQSERNKGYVIRGISYADFWFPKKKNSSEFQPASPFTFLPRFAIRDREKASPSDTHLLMDVSVSHQLVSKLVSNSKASGVISFGFKFYDVLRKNINFKRQIKRDLVIIQQKTLENQFTSDRVYRILSDEEEFNKIWEMPKFSRPLRIFQQPRLLNNIELKPYQILGFSWLYYMFNNGINALLADDTGLGKTIQVISLYAFLRESKNITGPHLIMAPKSVLITWKSEFEKIWPGCRVVDYTKKSHPRANLFQNVVSRCDFDVLLTRYSIAKNDAHLLNQITWRTIVFDEGHTLKNDKTILTKAIFTYYSEFRVILTATPFQNNLKELWALLYLISPLNFPSPIIFNQCFNELEAEEPDSEIISKIVEKLHSILKPFTLRRDKRDTDIYLPDKYEVTIKCSCSNLQRHIQSKVESGGYNLSQQIFILKRLANSPVLFLPVQSYSCIELDYLLSRTPKLRLLDRIVSMLIKTGHKFLIYSQWTSMMDLIEILLKSRLVNFARIDGSYTSSKRNSVIESFTKTDSSLNGLLLSTRSTSVGLNLQVADTVILFDSDYNPSIELQASSRVHRTGQKNKVLIIRLMTLNTGEESILNISNKKYVIGQRVFVPGAFSINKEKVESKITEHNLKDMIDPSDEDLINLISRGDKSDFLRLKMGHSESPNILEEETSYQSFDEECVNNYIKLINRSKRRETVESDEIDEFEDVD